MINTVTLVGRVGNDPQLKTFDSGSQVVEFSLATSEKWKDKNGEKKETTHWHKVKFWGKVADVLHKYVEKGSQFAVSGVLKYDTWQDKEGNNRTTAYVQGTSFEFCGKSASGRTDVNSPTGAKVQTNEDNPNGDDLPF